jgi:predicted dinucleotide-binding enzyme
MQIAVIGSGNIGGTLAARWAAAGHGIRLGVRDPGKSEVQQVLAGLGSNARAASIADAVGDAEVVLFAVPGAAMAETVRSLGGSLDGKLVIDATNNIGGSGAVNSLATIQAAAPNAHLYRAFNIYGWENFAEPTFDGIPADLFFVGSDGAARSRMEDLIRDVGLNPVWLGGLDHVDVVDALLRLWFALVFEQKKGRHLALKLLTR